MENISEGSGEWSQSFPETDSDRIRQLESDVGRLKYVIKLLEQEIKEMG
jgi:hypothetical protein